MIIAFAGVLFALLSSGACGSQSVQNVLWLPCQFVDEIIRLNSEGHRETEYHHRDAVLQFSNTGDRPINPNAITFLVTASKVDIRRYVEGGWDALQCEIRRYSTSGIVVRWPGLGAQEHDVWFICAFHHSEGRFVITTFLRHTLADSGFTEWIQVEDRQILTTSVALVVLTRTPSVRVGLMKDLTLHCQFAVDHKQANVTVEWRQQRRGERTKLFTYSSRTGQSEGSGVSLRGLSNAGNASLKLPPTTQASEGTYMCSVLVPPLYISQDITLSILEPPRVSVNVGSSLALTLGAEQKVMCDAEGYYPLDVTIEWQRERVGSSFIPQVLKNVLFSSHRNHQDGTYSLSAFFLLQPSLEDSGYKYTCRVYHKALLTPVRKSFTLSVTEPDTTWWYVSVLGFIILMIVILVWLMPQLNDARRQSARKRF
ncbi:tapasin-related protein-like [Electrophorus electricus]|uniref:tapasin-related protein-like n=1 Tax=Electrophorus electricus TaxID=8005 RepID=UPI0015CFB3EA|nr:tapasin-related protein-like [Electrophorus electricus]